jgi:hypothetical protein
VHHSASNPFTTTVGKIRDWHLAKGWDDIGYHRVIDVRGITHVGRNLTYDPAAQLGHNDGTFAICVVGDNTKEHWRWNRAQVNELIRQWVAYQVVYPGIEPYGHRDLVSSTLCPGLDIRPMLLGPRY